VGKKVMKIKKKKRGRVDGEREGCRGAWRIRKKERIRRTNE